MSPDTNSRFWRSVHELAAMREHIPPERRAGSLVRHLFRDLHACLANAKGSKS